MAITVTSKGSSSSTSQAVTYTATITAPTTNRVQLAFILNSKNTPPDSPNTSGSPGGLESTGLTWQRIADVSFPTGTPTRRLTAWRAQGTSSDTTVTINFPANQTACAWSFVELNGVDTTGVAGINAFADSAAATGSGTVLNLDLNGIVFAGDAVIAAFGLDTTSVITPAEGFTEIHDVTLGTQPNGRLQTQYHLTYDATPTATWTSSSSGGLALELKLIENAFKSNPKPGETVALTDTLTNIQLITASEPPIVIPLRSDTVTVSEGRTVQRVITAWYGSANLLDMPHAEDVTFLHEAQPAISMGGLWLPSVVDSLTLTDIATVTVVTLVIPVAETMSLLDNLVGPTLSSAAALSINVPAGITLTDTTTPNLISQPQQTDGLTLTDTSTVHVVHEPKAADSLTLTDTPAVHLMLAPQVTDGSTLTDTVTISGLTLKLPAGDLITISEQLPQVVTSGIIAVDNFDDNIQNAGIWEVAASSSPSDALVLVSETGHQLTITPRSSFASDAFNGYRTLSSYNLTNVAIFVEVPQVANVATTANTIFTLSIDANNLYRIVQEQGTIYFQDRVAGLTNSGTLTYNASTHRWWRIRHVSAGDTIRFDTSVNGTVWTEQRSISRVLSVTGMRFGIEAGTYTSVPAPGVAIFDNINSTTLTIFPTDLLTLSDARAVHLIHKIQTSDSLAVTDTATFTFLKAATLQDNFDDNTQDTAKWTKQSTHNTTFTDALVTVNETSQQVHITTRSGVSGNAFNGYRSLKVYDLGNSAVHAHVLQVAGVGTSANTMLVAALNSTNWYRIIQEAGFLYFQDNVGGTITGPSITYNNSMHRWWRIRHNLGDNTILWETSTDGVAWTSRRTPITPPFAITALSLGIEAGTYTSVTGTQLAIFDSFNIAGVSNTVAIDEGDAVTLTDVAEVALVAPLSDTVTVTDFAQAGLWTTSWSGSTNLLEQPHPADSITLTDARTVTLSGVGGPLTINVPDLVTLTDARTVQGLALPIVATDTLTVSDDRTVLIPVAGVLQIPADDAVTLIDAATVKGLMLVGTGADSVTLTDTHTITGLTLPIQATDSVTPSEQRTVNLVSEPKAADTVTSTDTVTVKGLVLQINPTDSITLTDASTLTGLILPIPAADLITLGENRTVIAAIPGIWQIPGADSVTVADASTVSGLTLKPIIADTVTLPEQRTVGLRLMPQATDSVTLTDIVTVKGLLNRITAVDAVTLSDAATWQLSKIVITRGELLTLSDVATRNLVDQFVTTPLIVFAVPSRDFTVEAVVGVTQFVVAARDMTVEAPDSPLVFTVAARDFTVEAVAGITQFVVPARDFTVEAAA